MRSLLLRQADPGAPRASGAAEVVEWFGAMQAQDHASGLWSLGRRLAGSTRDDVLAAVERGEVLRTWPMRGTIHLVPPRDARWMLATTGEKALLGAARRRETLGLTQADAERAVEVLGEATAGRRLTRSQCREVLAAAGLAKEGQGPYHLLWYASQRGVICIGPHEGNEQTFVRLDEWAPHQNEYGREEALALLAHRFVRSHGPVAVKDFAGWADIGVREARAAVAAVGDAVSQVTVDVGGTVVPMVVASDALDAVRGPAGDAGPVWDALSGFDEYALGYKDRSLHGDAATLAAVVPGNNGMFKWTLVRDGAVVGTWSRKPTSKVLRTQVDLVHRVPAAQRAAAERALAGYAAWAGGLPAEAAWAGP